MGRASAGEFHARMFGRRGQADGASALAVVREMGLDPEKIEESGDSPAVTDVLTRQAKLAANLGMEDHSVLRHRRRRASGLAGQDASLRGIVANARKCDHPVCGA